MNKDGYDYDICEADDGSIEVDHDIEMNIEQIDDIAGQYYTSNINNFFPVDPVTIIDLKHLEET